MLAKPPGSSWSHVMYLTSACPEVPAGVTGLPLSCLEGTTSAALYAELEAGETVWLFVDGASTSVFGIKEGPYALTVDLCTPDCDGVECGSDGCGGECGPCPSGLYCDEDDGACVDVPPESSCAGICGESPGECWCDDACFEYGDCCEDVCEHCADYYPYECSSWM